MRARLSGDRGAGTVLGLAVAAVAVLLATIAVPLAGALPAQQRTDAAADSAALAAADTLSGRLPGYPCENARRVAAADGVDLAACDLDGPIAVVATRHRYLALTLAARARAGPPGSR